MFYLLTGSKVFSAEVDFRSVVEITLDAVIPTSNGLKFTQPNLFSFQEAP